MTFSFNHLQFGQAMKHLLVYFKSPLGQWRYILVVLVFVGAQSVFAGAISDDTVQASGRLATASSSAAAKAQPRSFVLERRFKDKTLCRVTLHGQATTTNLLDTVDHVEISLDGRRVAMPPEVYSGWNDLDPSSGIQLAEAGKTRSVILSGGKPGTRWHAKLTIQKGTLIGWDYTPESRRPVLPPMLVRHPILIPRPAIKITPASISNHVAIPENAPLNTQGQ